MKATRKAADKQQLLGSFARPYAKNKTKSMTFHTFIFFKQAYFDNSFLSLFLERRSDVLCLKKP
jgi:hypothetical protein